MSRYKDSNPSPIAISSDSFFYEKDKSDNILIMGVGNYLMGDEGVGIHIIQEMAKLDLPEKVDILDGGTGGFTLLGFFESYPKIVFVDATVDGNPPGTLSMIKPRFASDFPNALSVHDVGLKDMVEAVYLMDQVPEIHLLTISIEEVKPMEIGLSEQVKSAIPLAIDKIVQLTQELHS